MDNGQNLVRAHHLEDVANGAKRYTLREVLDVTNAVSTELESINVDFTGATSISGGASGMVPAPAVCDRNHFLRGDGNWARPDTGNVVLDTVASAVEGALWKDSVNDVPLLKLRHGDYEYNFQYDSITYLGGSSSATETVEPDTYILGTASVSSEGGIWYEITDNVPTLWFHSGNFNYGINYSTITYKGDTTNMVCYLPFDSAEMADALGNEWVTYGTPTIIDDANSFSGKALSLNGSSYLTNNMIAPLIGSWPSTIDFWSMVRNNAQNYTFCGTYNANYGTSSADTDYWLNAMRYSNKYAYLNFYGNENKGTVMVENNTRHHYAVTYDGTTVRMFVDGVLATERIHNVALGGNFCIGAYPAVNGGADLNGTIDHFRIFKAALWTENFTPPVPSDYL